ncbi:hypothetical protein LSH36_353g04002 [Paralvinella palmiformis]|uniref:EGF-like domain-containing protein n=1 Tax=Paralvinella palmiformis TaxID=53620 RepID=A0AAD9JEX4_9ANNE|nr:hypothetical protein LSH36_353g04002 [Paralvinella palmiformis]
MDKMHISITVAAILFWNFNLTWSLNVTTTAIPETELVSVNRTELGIPPGENPGNETELVSTPTPIDPCAAGICQNGGTCIGNSSSTLGYECRCLEGWMGKNCTQKDFCSSSPCHNNGTCSQNVTAVDRCTPNPCQNNANCTNIPGDFNCSCPSGYGGKNCSLGLPMTCRYSFCIE